MFLLQFIIIQTIVFGVVIFVLKKVMVGNTESAVNRLNESYIEMNKKKEELAQKIKEVEDEYQAKRREGERIANSLRDQAEKEMSDKRDSILNAAREESEKIIADTLSAAEKIREEIRQEEKLKIVDVCRDLLQITFKDSVSDRIDELLIIDFLDEFKDVESSHIPPTVREAEVVTREKLSGDLRDRVLKSIKDKAGREIGIKETVDKDILGGIIVKFGSLVLDSSVAGKLHESDSMLKERVEKSA